MAFAVGPSIRRLLNRVPRPPPAWRRGCSLVYNWTLMIFACLFLFICFSFLFEYNPAQDSGTDGNYSVFYIIPTAVTSSQPSKEYKIPYNEFATISINRTAEFYVAGSQNPIPIDDPCLNGWSAGSAFFTVVSLLAAYFAQPPGSLICIESARIWRLSPFFALLEAWSIAKRTVSGLRKGYPLHVVLLTLLAVRVANSWTLKDVDDFLAKENNNENAGRQREAGRHGVNPEAQAPSAPGIVSAIRRLLPWELPVGSRPGYQEIPPYRPNEEEEAELLQGEQALNRHLRALGSSKPLDAEMQDKIFEEQLQIALDANEDGGALRVLVWILALLQFVKLVSVSGAWVARSLGFVYFAAWLLVEVMLVTTSWKRPSHFQQCVRLGRAWRTDFVLPPPRDRGNAMLECRSHKNMPFFAYLFFCAMLNGYAITCMTVLGEWVGRLYELPSVSNPVLSWFVGRLLHSGIFLPVTILITTACLLVPLVVVFFVIVVAEWAIHCVAKRSSLFRTRQLYYPTATSILASSGGVTMIALIVLSFNGVGTVTELTYSCASTSVPGWYDWLG